MTKQKSTKRALLLSALSLLMCVSMLIGSTFAWFTDSVTSGNNKIVSGNLDVEFEYAKVVDGKLTEWATVKDAENIFDPNALWEPGRVEVVYLKVSNLGTLALKYQLGVNVSKETPGKTEDDNDIYLSKHLVFKTVEMPDALTTYTDRQAIQLAAGSEKGLKDYNGKTTTLEARNEAGTSNFEDYVALIVYMPETVGNEANYRGTDVPTIELGVNLFATQVEAESDSFGNDYDENAWADGMKVYNAQELQAAIDNAKDGDVIVFFDDIESVDGIVITDKRITLDMNGQTFAVSDGASTNNRNVKINGNSEVTIKNGTLIADGTLNTGAYGTIRTEDAAKVTLSNMKLYNYRGNGLNVKACEGTTVIINDTEIYSQYGGGVEAAGGTVELNNVKIEQKGMWTAPYNSMAVSVNGGGKATINSGTYTTECLTAEEANNQGSSHGPWTIGVLNSGGTLVVNGGTFSNDNFGENTLATNARGLVLADTGAVIEINGGTFNAVKSIVDIQNNLGDASKNPSVTLTGGTFSADPTISVNNLVKIADGYEVRDKDDGSYEVKSGPVAKVGNTSYYTIDEAVANWTANSTLTLLKDVTLSDVIKIKSTEHHILDLGTYTMTAASKKDAIQIENNGRSSASYALDIKADANNPGGITATGKAIVRTAGKSGVKDRPIIRFYNGVFNASYIVYHTGSNGTNCPQFQFHGGEFNGAVYSNRTLNQFYGGTFNGSLMMSVDSSAYALISGGTFKQLSNLYMSALNSDKFTIGSAKGTFNREVYINDEGYYVVATTEPSEGIEAAVSKTPGTNEYLKYSKVGTDGVLKYTDVYLALKDNKAATITVYVNELNLAGVSFTGKIIVPEGSSLSIANAPDGLNVEGNVTYR